MALLNAMFLTAVLTLTLVAMISYTQGTFKATRRVKYDAQVYNVARAGLVDAIAWFKRQDTQPVVAFAPVVNTTNRLKGDTDDPLNLDPGGASASTPNLGIVQEMPIDLEKGLWGRYEVGKITKLNRDADGEFTVYKVRERHPVTKGWGLYDVSACTSTDYEGVQDVSEDYGMQGQGLIWRIRSHGYVYRRDPAAPASTPFYTAPNKVLAQIDLDTEIFRLNFRDYNAAITGDKANQVLIPPKGPIKGGDGWALQLNEGPLAGVTATATYTSNMMPAVRFVLPDTPPKLNLDWLEVFGVSDPGIISSLADSSGVDHSAYLNKDMALTYIRPAAGQACNFIVNGVNRSSDGHKPLTGGGILVIDGDLNIDNWSANSFAGFIYVAGRARFRGINNLQGQLVVKGPIDMDNSSSLNFEYNGGLLSTIRKRLAQYRERRASLRVVQE